MKTIVVSIISTMLALSAYGQTITNGKATASGGCSVAHSGNDDTIIIKNCGIGAEQGQKIIDLIKEVLANQDLAAINKKLDELLSLASTPPIHSTLDFNVPQPEPSTNGHPRASVRFYFDRIWPSGDIAVVCDRACIGGSWSLCSLPGVNPGSALGTIPGETRIVGLVFNRDFPAGVWCTTTVESADDKPVKIVNVLPLTVPKKPPLPKP
jgi:hypothetical protein